MLNYGACAVVDGRDEDEPKRRQTSIQEHHNRCLAIEMLVSVTGATWFSSTMSNIECFDLLCSDSQNKKLLVYCFVIDPH